MCFQTFTDKILSALTFAGKSQRDKLPSTDTDTVDSEKQQTHWKSTVILTVGLVCRVKWFSLRNEIAESVGLADCESVPYNQ